jgi:vitamin B12/bleomycin/antimicrobial peptide transport system ATP-binding/permease protein
MTLYANEPTLLVGPSGSGKSTLFRAIAGIWRHGEGRISEPSASLMLLPQRPYLPIGSLRAAISYPAPADRFSDEAMRDAISSVGLCALAERLDAVDNWQMLLSGGEQQAARRRARPSGRTRPAVSRRGDVGSRRSQRSASL